MEVLRNRLDMSEPRGTMNHYCMSLGSCLGLEALLKGWLTLGNGLTTDNWDKEAALGIQGLVGCSHELHVRKYRLRGNKSRQVDCLGLCRPT